MPLRLDRRTVLRGLLGGVGVSVGLPILEANLDATRRARAAAGFPRRFGLFFWGNGVLPAKWNPIGAGEGEAWQLNEQMAALAPHKAKISVVSGMNVLVGNSIPHGSGPAGLLSGAPLIVRSGDDFTFSAPSIDQVLAQEIGGDTRFRSLEVGVRPGPGLSYNGPESRNPPESSPRRVFERLFGGGFRAPGSEPIVDPKLRLRRSVLDAVIGDANRLSGKLGTADRQRVQQHLEGVRDLERRLQRLEENPPNLEACAAPEMPAADYPDVEGRPRLSEISRVMCDLIAMALACDQTRVFSHWFTHPVNNVLFPGAPAGHHRLTHDEPGDQPQVDAIVKTIIAELAYLVEALDRVPEGDGTLLEHSVVLGTTDVSFGRTHALDDYPLVLAGSACGALKMGLHYRSPSGENASKLMLTLLRAMGVARAEFGAEAGRTDVGLGAIEA